ncbi:MAG: AI-2E family transporter [Bacteroidales bacterium]
MSSFFEKEFTFDRVARIFFVALLTTVIALFTWRIREALIPFFIGWLIAAVLMPIVRFFQYKLRFKFRIPSIFATILVILAGLTLVFWLVIPPAIQEFEKTGKLLQEYELRYKDDPMIPLQIREYIDRFVDFDDYNRRFDSQQILEQIKKYIPKILDIVISAVKKIFNLISIVFMFLYAFFIMIYYEEIRDGFFDLLPQGWRHKTRKVIHDVAASTNRYFRGQTLVASLVGVGFCIGFLIIGLPLAIPLGIFIGLLNMIPYAQFIGLFPTIFMCLLHSVDTGIPFWRLIIFCLMVFAIVQIIEDTLLTPKIMGKVTGLNPAVILLCLSIGGTLFGVIGIIMSLPLAPMLLAYYHMYILKDTPGDSEIEKPVENKRNKSK